MRHLRRCRDTTARIAAEDFRSGPGHGPAGGRLPGGGWSGRPRSLPRPLGIGRRPPLPRRHPPDRSAAAVAGAPLPCYQSRQSVEDGTLSAFLCYERKVWQKKQRKSVSTWATDNGKEIFTSARDVRHHLEFLKGEIIRTRRRGHF